MSTYKKGYIYILGNEKPVLYIGVTSNLIQRIYQHKHKMVKGFSNTYNLDKLLYYEVFENIADAIAREKNLKNWEREWKLDLIKKMNSRFEDLYHKLL